MISVVLEAILILLVHKFLLHKLQNLQTNKIAVLHVVSKLKVIDHTASNSAHLFLVTKKNLKLLE